MSVEVPPVRFLPEKILVDAHIFSSRFFPFKIITFYEFKIFNPVSTGLNPEQPEHTIRHQKKKSIAVKIIFKKDSVVEKYFIQGIIQYCCIEVEVVYQFCYMILKTPC